MRQNYKQNHKLFSVSIPVRRTEFLAFLMVILLVAGPLVARTAPNFALPKIDETRTVLYAALEKLGKNDILIINFTASFCRPCKIEVPRMVKFRNEINKSKRKGKLHLWIIFVGDDKKKASSTAKKLGVPSDVPLLYDILEASYDRFDFKGVPVTIALNKKGEILVREDGYNEKKFKIFTDSIKKVLK